MFAKPSQSLFLMKFILRMLYIISQYYKTVSSFVGILFCGCFFYDQLLYLSAPPPHPAYPEEQPPGLAHNSFTIKLNVMIPDKSVLLEQINTVIRNSYKDSPDLPDFSLPGNFSNPKFPADLGTIRTSLLDQ